jgi:hypothetical protein
MVQKPPSPATDKPSTRFKPGQSGKPKGTRNATTLALQCPLETIRHALLRTGGLGGPLVTLLDKVGSQSEDGRT